MTIIIRIDKELIADHAVKMGTRHFCLTDGKILSVGHYDVGFAGAGPSIEITDFARRFRDDPTISPDRQALLDLLSEWTKRGANNQFVMISHSENAAYWSYRDSNNDLQSELIERGQPCAIGGFADWWHCYADANGGWTRQNALKFCALVDEISGIKPLTDEFVSDGDHMHFND